MVTANHAWVSTNTLKPAVAPWMQHWGGGGVVGGGCGLVANSGTRSGAYFVGPFSAGTSNLPVESIWVVSDRAVRSCPINLWTVLDRTIGDFIGPFLMWDTTQLFNWYEPSLI